VQRPRLLFVTVPQRTELAAAFDRPKIGHGRSRRKCVTFYNRETRFTYTHGVVSNNAPDDLLLDIVIPLTLPVRSMWSRRYQRSYDGRQQSMFVKSIHRCR
jgi:hypothetical protein